MVKTPKTRHSKSRRKPVTIDLDPASVSRASGDGEGSGVKADEGTRPAETAMGSPAVEARPAETGAQENASLADTPATGAETSGEDETAEAVSTPPHGEDSGLQERMDSEERPADAMSDGPPFGRTPPPPEPREPARSGGSGVAFLAGVVGAVIALLLAGFLQWYGVLPSAGGKTGGDDQRIADLQQQVASMKDTIANSSDSSAAATQKTDQLQGSVASLKSSVEKIQSGTAAGGDKIQPLEAEVSKLQKQVADLAGNGDAQKGVDALQQRVSKVQADLQSATDAANKALQSNDTKLKSLDERISALSQKVQANGNQPSVVRLVAASTLKAAIDRGGSFDGALEAFAKVTPDAPDLSTLQPFAASGIDTRVALASQVDAAASKMVDAAREDDPNGGYAERLWNSARSLVDVRPVGVVEGNDVPAIVARFEADVKAGNYDKALAEYAKLPDDAKAAGKPFVDKLRARQAADTIMDKALSDALKAA